MTAPVFVDSNVLVYARDASEPVKQARASAWLEQLWGRRAGRVSVQVLHEFYTLVTGKLDPGMSREGAREDVRNLMAWSPLGLDTVTLEGAWSVQDRFGLSFWDALIVAAAQVSGCGLLLTEDLQDGQDLDGVRVVDPFRHPPAEVL